MKPSPLHRRQDDLVGGVPSPREPLPRGGGHRLLIPADAALAICDVSPTGLQEVIASLLPPEPESAGRAV